MKPPFLIRLQQHQGLVVVQKPPGMNTHRPDPDKPGLLEFLQVQTQTKLYVVHRLDKETSGVLLLAQNADLAQKLGHLFETHQVQKEYLFLTDKKIKSTELEIESEISKVNEQFVSQFVSQSVLVPNTPEPKAAVTGALSSALANTANAKTRFIRLREGAQYTLWRALPETGKPHQIRLHAQDAGIPILGDRKHGGSRFFRLCLHAEKISFPLETEHLQFESTCGFNEHIADSPRFHFQEALWKRTQFLDFSQIDSARWSHNESGTFRLDQYGPQLWMAWYGKQDPDLKDPLFSDLAKALPLPLWIRQMKSRGETQGTQAFLLSQRNPVPVWSAFENGTQYELRSEQGLSPGLFLDQRENRRWVKQNSRDHRVLNLFAYTGGFSVNAALGQAKEVCTVDTSRAFLDWSKRNFSLNDLNPTDPKYEFWAQDCLLFLKGCLKRERKFDLIICDPPTLGRTKEGTFDLKRDLNKLLQACWIALAPKGQLLFSCNYEGWDLKNLRELCEQALGPANVKIQAAPGSPLDYESSPHESLMKSLLLSRISHKN